MQQIGVFGASFNPPTVGHQDVIMQCDNFFDQILLVPSLSHAFNKALVPISDRLHMLQLFLKTWDLPAHVNIFNIEADLQQASDDQHAPIYTFDVLTKLTELYQTQQKPVQIWFIMGPDISQPSVWHKFYRYQDIEKNWPLFHVKERLPIRSTMVREIMLQYAKAPQRLKAELAQLVGEPIVDYILLHQLYQG